MKGYPLQRLLAVREHKVEEARLEAGRRRRLLDEAIQRAEEAQALARTFSEQRPEKEDQLFGDIRNTVVDRQGMEEYRAALNAILEEEIALHDAAAQARKEQAEAQAALDAAMEAHRQAMLDVKKIEEHRAVWIAQEKERLEAVEEAETEEAAASMSSPSRRRLA